MIQFLIFFVPSLCPGGNTHLINEQKSCDLAGDYTSMVGPLIFTLSFLIVPRVNM